MSPLSRPLLGEPWVSPLDLADWSSSFCISWCAPSSNAPAWRLCSHTHTHTHTPCAQIYREKYRRRRRRARNRDQAMARRGHEVARGLEAVSEREAEHRELQSQGGAAGSLLRKQLETALHFLPTSEYGARARAAGGALERADKPAKKGGGEGQTGGTEGGPGNGQEESMCSICLNDYEDDKMCSTLPCGHVFHRECITCWLRSGRMAGAECPLCKAERASEPHPLPLPAPTSSPGPTLNERVRLG